MAFLAEIPLTWAFNLKPLKPMVNHLHSGNTYTLPTGIWVYLSCQFDPAWLHAWRGVPVASQSNYLGPWLFMLSFQDPKNIEKNHGCLILRGSNSLDDLCQMRRSHHCRQGAGYSGRWPHGNIDCGVGQHLTLQISMDLAWKNPFF